MANYFILFSGDHFGPAKGGHFALAQGDHFPLAEGDSFRWFRGIILEWFIHITTNKFGRLFKKLLTPEMWSKIEQTFSGRKIEDNWDALFAIADLVSEIGTELSEKLGYEYPAKLEMDIRKYLSELKMKSQ